ncbi:6239_t:CDS:1, partial [Racocetra persica]
RIMISQSRLAPIPNSSASLYAIVSTSTVNNLTVELIRQIDGSYFVKHMNSYTLFCVPSVPEACAMGRAPASCFILFRSKIQGCLVSLNLRLERRIVSRHAANLWRGININDPLLSDTFRRIYDAALYQFNSMQMRIRIVRPPASPEQPLESVPTIDGFDNSFNGLLTQLFNLNSSD